MLNVRPGDHYVIVNGFTCHVNTFFSDEYVPFARHESFEMALSVSFTVIAVKHLKNVTIHQSPWAFLLLRHKDNVLCSTYVWENTSSNDTMLKEMCGVGP